MVAIFKFHPSIKKISMNVNRHFCGRRKFENNMRTLKVNIVGFSSSIVEITEQKTKEMLANEMMTWNQRHSSKFKSSNPNPEIMGFFLFRTDKFVVFMALNHLSSSWTFMNLCLILPEQKEPIRIVFIIFKSSTDNWFNNQYGAKHGCLLKSLVKSGRHSKTQTEAGEGSVGRTSIPVPHWTPEVKLQL